MNASKCDRCQKFYDRYNSHYENNGITLLSHTSTLIMGRGYIDLCPTCEKEFYEWMTKNKQGGEQLGNKKV